MKGKKFCGFVTMFTAAVAATGMLVACGGGSSGNSLTITGHSVAVCEAYTEVKGYEASDPVSQTEGEKYYYIQIAMQYTGAEDSAAVEKSDFRLKAGETTYNCIDFIRIGKKMESTEEQDGEYDTIKRETVTPTLTNTLAKKEQKNGWTGVLTAFALSDELIGSTAYTVEYNNGQDWRQLVVSDSNSIISRDGALVNSDGLYMAVDWDETKGVAYKVRTAQTNTITTHYKYREEKTVTETYAALSVTVKNDGDKRTLKASDILLTVDGKEYAGKAFLTQKLEIHQDGAASTTVATYTQSTSEAVNIQFEALVFFELEAIPVGYTVKLK